MAENVFEPLGVKDATFEPSEQMREHVVEMGQRNSSGKIVEGEHLNKKAMGGAFELFYHSGGSGLFIKPKEFTKVVSTILNNGTSPLTGKRILSPETVSLMFENQIPEHPKGLPTCKPLVSNAVPDLYPQGDAPQGWGLSWFLTLEPTATGRAANTAFWGGLGNQYYWCDKTTGVAGMVAASFLPFGDMGVLQALSEIEAAVYANLE